MKSHDICLDEISDQVVDGFFIWTFANHGYLPYVRNCLLTLKRAGIQWQPTVFCLDKKLYEELEGFCPVYYYPAMVATTFEDSSSKLYSDICTIKLNVTMSLLRTFIGSQTRILYFDTDIAFYRDPLPYLSNLNDDFLIQCGEPSARWNDQCRGRCSNFCTGFFVIKPLEKFLEYFDYENSSDVTKYCEDQGYLNFRFRQNNWTFKTLPRDLFPNGSHCQFFSDMKEKYILHYNFMVGNEKIERMRKYGDWLL